MVCSILADRKVSITVEPWQAICETVAQCNRYWYLLDEERPGGLSALLNDTKNKWWLSQIWAQTSRQTVILYNMVILHNHITSNPLSKHLNFTKSQPFPSCLHNKYVSSYLNSRAPEGFSSTLSHSPSLVSTYLGSVEIKLPSRHWPCVRHNDVKICQSVAWNVRCIVLNFHV